MDKIVGFSVTKKQQNPLFNSFECDFLKFHA
jgi:hypothetical protein